MNPAMDPTLFSNIVTSTIGSYSLSVQNLDMVDSESSRDSIQSIDITFTGNDGRVYKIDAISIVHKADGTGNLTFFGGVGPNKTIHGEMGRFSSQVIFTSQLLPRYYRGYLLPWRGWTSLPVWFPF